MILLSLQFLLLPPPLLMLLELRLLLLCCSCFCSRLFFCCQRRRRCLCERERVREEVYVNVSAHVCVCARAHTIVYQRCRCGRVSEVQMWSRGCYQLACCLGGESRNKMFPSFSASVPASHICSNARLKRMCVYCAHAREYVRCIE